MDFAASVGDNKPPSSARSADCGRSRTLNTLAREGIVPVKEQRATSGSKFGQAAPRSHFSSDQQRSFSEISDNITPAVLKNGSSTGPVISRIPILPRQLWAPFGDGWSQLTPSDSGKRTKYGLHCVIESAPRRAFLCCYVPHVPEVLSAVTSSFPQYDIEVAVKAMKFGVDKGGDFCLLLGFHSAAQYLYIVCDTEQRLWRMAIHCEEGDIPLALIPMDSLKCNCFYELLLQVRGDTVSLDVNAAPVFTAVRIPDSVSIGGLTGVLAQDSKFAMKGWKFRAISGGPSPMRRASASAPAPGGQSRNAFGLRPAPPAPAPYREHTAASPQRDVYNDPYGSPALYQSANPAPEYGCPVRRSPPAAKKPSGGVRSLSEIMGLSPAPQGSPPPPAASSILAAHQARSQQQWRQPPPEPDHPPPPAHYSPHPQGSARYAGSGIGRASDSHAGELSNVRNKMHSYMNGGADSASYGGGYTEPAPPVRGAEEAPALSAAEQHAREVGLQLGARHDKHVVETVMRDVIQRDLGVTFDDIAAVPVAKRLLHEAVILPLIMPEFFTGIREPWKGVLLFGPPGTGKTMLAKAVAGVNGSTFFSCSAASLISKYRGESEKIIKCLFEAARLCAPSIIFMDEVDALVASRGAEGEHEASRRLKTELFSEMDGIASSSCQSVMLLATTNCPWDLDEAMRRRLEKRIYIPLPDEAARAELFEICMRSVDVDSARVGPAVLAASTEGYSGADIRIVCREAAMMPMRRLLLEKRPEEIQRLRAAGQLVISKVQLDDFMTAIQNTSPSVSSSFDDKYLAWDREYGSR